MSFFLQFNNQERAENEKVANERSSLPSGKAAVQIRFADETEVYFYLAVESAKTQESFNVM